MEAHLPVEIETVSTDEDIECVAALAREIWTHHYVQIIGEEQVEYMLLNFQSSAAIKSQIADGAEYFLVKIENKPVGYLGLSADKNTDKMLLSKLYLKNVTRGIGAGKAILNFVESKCVAENISFVWLTVNKRNAAAINWYKHRGFVVIDEVKSDIGGGFFMDDYIMQKSIGGNT